MIAEPSSVLEENSERSKHEFWVVDEVTSPIDVVDEATSPFDVVDEATSPFDSIRLGLVTSSTTSEIIVIDRLNHAN